MLLRVGIDKGTDGSLAPIFEDGSFEYIPLSETDKTSEKRTFDNTFGRKGKKFAYYLPEKIKDRKLHFDPEFDTYTYGDTGYKSKYLLKLNKGDLLVFYAGLKPYNNTNFEEALYIIGYLTVEKVIDFSALSENEINEFSIFLSNNAHIKRISGYNNVVVVYGNKKKSKLLDNAILISERKLNSIGRKYHAVSAQIEKSLGISGSIQRSIPPRFIVEDNNMDNLKFLLGFR
ncbi:hypothetical protein [Methanobacterium sp.]|uniref:Nmad3 family putative nucleotide modification protein n=1 Tax=Methanobacterium sp. TaxID=2164 RepID=UPI003D6601E8